jgi:PAS domain S-box-containing protein
VSIGALVDGDTKRLDEHLWGAAFLRQIVELSPDGLMVVDDGQVIVLVNEAVERIFGYTRAELVGSPLHALVPEALRGAHQHHVSGFVKAPVARLMGGGKELSGRRRDGSEITLDVSLSPVSFEGRTYVVAGVRDTVERVSEQARSQGRTFKAQNERDEQRLARLSGTHDTQVTRESLGMRPLRLVAPELWANLVARYAALIERSIEKQTYRVDGAADEDPKVLAEDLAGYQAGPRDLIEIHTGAIVHMKLLGASPRAQAVQHEASLVLLEVMGNLASAYRRQSLGTLSRRGPAEGGST